MIAKLHYISQGNSPKDHLDNIQNACASGTELVQLDIQNISEKKFLKIELIFIPQKSLLTKKRKKKLKTILMQVSILKIKKMTTIY